MYHPTKEGRQPRSGARGLDLAVQLSGAVGEIKKEVRSHKAGKTGPALARRDPNDLSAFMQRRSRKDDMKRLSEARQLGFSSVADLDSFEREREAREKRLQEHHQFVNLVPAHEKDGKNMFETPGSRAVP